MHRIKNKVSYFLTGILFLTVLLISGFLVFPNVDYAYAYSGSGPDANGLYYTYAGGAYRVSDCDESVNSITIPNTVTVITNDAFPKLHLFQSS